MYKQRDIKIKSVDFYAFLIPYFDLYNYYRVIFLWISANSIYVSFGKSILIGCSFKCLEKENLQPFFLILPIFGLS